MTYINYIIKIRNELKYIFVKNKNTAKSIDPQRLYIGGNQGDIHYALRT